MVLSPPYRRSALDGLVEMLPHQDSVLSSAISKRDFPICRCTEDLEEFLSPKSALMSVLCWNSFGARTFDYSTVGDSELGDCHPGSSSHLALISRFDQLDVH